MAAQLIEQAVRGVGSVVAGDMAKCRPDDVVLSGWWTSTPPNELRFGRGCWVPLPRCTMLLGSGVCE